MEKLLHLIDLDDTLIKVDIQPWIIKKEDPNNPIIRLKNSERKLIENEFFKKEDLLIKYSGKEYWISKEIYEFLNKKAGKEVDLTKYGISYAEFFDPIKIQKQSDKLELLLNNIKHLKNTKEDIVLMSDRYDTELHLDLLNKVKEELSKLNIEIKNTYFLSNNNLKNTLYDPSYYKSILLLEKMIGYKITNNSFIDFELDQYNKVYFYDDDRLVIDSIKNIQSFFNTIYFNSKEEIRAKIISKVMDIKPFVKIHQVTGNEYDLFKTESIILERPSRIHKFNFFV